MRLSLKDLAEQFYGFMVGVNAPGTIAYYRRHIDRFIAHVGDLDVAELKRHHLKAWSQKWHALQAVQRLFTWAHTDMELIERNPFKGIKRPKMGGRKRVLSRQEIATLMRKTDLRFRIVLLALRESIIRPQEVRVLRWEMIRWEGDHKGALAAIAAGDAFFELWEYKSRSQRLDPDSPRVILINGRFARLLLRLAKRCKELKGEIFTNQRCRPWTSNAVRLRMRRLCNRSKISEDACRTDLSGFWPHESINMLRSSSADASLPTVLSALRRDAVALFTPVK